MSFLQEKNIALYQKNFNFFNLLRIFFFWKLCYAPHTFLSFDVRSSFEIIRFVFWPNSIVINNRWSSMSGLYFKGQHITLKKDFNQFWVVQWDTVLFQQTSFITKDKTTLLKALNQFGIFFFFYTF